jgi:hypothetical protein
MTNAQQKRGIENRLTMDGLMSRRGVVQGGKENLMAELGRWTREPP